MTWGSFRSLVVARLKRPSRLVELMELIVSTDAPSSTALRTDTSSPAMGTMASVEAAATEESSSAGGATVDRSTASTPTS